MVQSFRGVLALAAFGLLGCGGRTDGTEGLCDSLVGCGGNLQGTWDITSVCARVVDGPSVMSGIPACDATARHALDVATYSTTDATLSFTDTTYAQLGTTTLDTTYAFTDACLAARGLGSASDATCSELQISMLQPMLGSIGQTQFTFVQCAADTGTCVCQVSGERPFDMAGTYHTAGTRVFFDSDFGAGNDYCVQGGRGVITLVSNGVRERYSLKRH